MTDEHNNITKHTTTEKKLDAFADQLAKTFTNDGDTTNYDDNWKQTVDAYIDTMSWTTWEERYYKMQIILHSQS